MLALKPFQKLTLPEGAKLQLDADLKLLGPDSLELTFSWTDSKNLIIQPESPGMGRHHELWKQTCFEAFIQPANKVPYFEVNLSTQKAWNVYGFEAYREPQPPTEVSSADAIKIDVKEGNLKAVIQFRKSEFKKVKVSLCAVLNLKDIGPTYWSFAHADQKPNFHKFESFIIERNAP